MRVRANGMDLEYEAFGDGAAPPMVLIQGFAQQLITWDDDFCSLLAARGFRVLRFDNRDIGLSTHLDAAPRPNLPAILGGDHSTVSYTIDDMGDDTAGLIDALGISPAHVTGVSMGGMIAQSLALRHPGRILSLASIMSTTGDRTVGQPSPETLSVLIKPPPTERTANIEQGVHSWRVLRSPGYPFDEARVRDRVSRAFDRAFYPRGVGRQLGAILAQRDRTEGLRAIRVPTVVVHGADDPLVHVSGGEATARAIPDAKLVVVPGMGHDLPQGLWPRLIDALVENARRA